MTDNSNRNKTYLVPSNLHTEDDLFYFETDDLALRGNKDYSELLKTLFILNAQREQAIKDYDTAVQIKKESLRNPIEAVEKIKGDGLDVPPLQTIVEIPNIKWYSYDTKIPEEELKSIYTDEPERKDSEEFVKHKDLANTHKQHWTPEEQKRLEELLVKFPPEAIELRRVKKIAAALGNRTVKQVSSRLQKYFLKLYKAGLHVPGRVPKSADRRKLKHKHSQQLWKPTTFFPEYNVSVFMNESESVPGPSRRSSKDDSSEPSSSASTQNYLLPIGYDQDRFKESVCEKSSTELQLELLKRIRSQKIKESESTSEQYRHLTYRCDYCNETPICGTRWHCSSCSGDSVDFCTDCILAQLYSDNCHPLTHTFVTLLDSESIYEMSSNSDSESADESPSQSYFNNSDVSDSECDQNTDLNRYKTSFQRINGNGFSQKCDDSDMTKKNSESSVGSNRQRSTRKTGQRVSFDESDLLSSRHSYEEKNVSIFSTQDISYNYLHSNLLLDE